VASGFSLDASTCNLDYNGYLANIRPNSDLSALYFDTQAQIQTNGYAPATCSVSSNQLSCGAQGETIVYSCGANTALALGSIVPDGCSVVSLTLVSQPCGVSSSTPIYLRASGSGTAADEMYLLTVDNGSGTFLGLLSANPLQASALSIQNTVGWCNLDYNGEPATIHPGAAQGDNVFFAPTNSISADGSVPATCVLDSSNVLHCNADGNQLIYVCPPSMEIGIGSSIPTGCSSVVLTAVLGTTCGLPSGTTFVIMASGTGFGTAGGGDFNGQQIYFNAATPSSATQFFYSELDGTCILAYGTNGDTYAAWASEGGSTQPAPVLFEPESEFYEQPNSCAISSDYMLTCTAWTGTVTYVCDDYWCIGQEVVSGCTGVDLTVLFT